MVDDLAECTIADKERERPLAEARAAASALRASRAKNVTFEQAARSYIAAHESGWRNAKHAQQWRNTLASYAYPEIGELMVRDVELAQVWAVLEPIWTEKPKPRPGCEGATNRCWIGLLPPSFIC